MPKDRRSRKHSRRLGSLRRILERLEKRRESDSEESSESSLTDVLFLGPSITGNQQVLQCLETTLTKQIGSVLTYTRNWRPVGLFISGEGLLSAERRKDLLSKYLSQKNILLPAYALKNDRLLSGLQEQLGAGMAILGSILSQKLGTPDRELILENDAVEKLAKAGQLFANVHQAVSSKRKFEIISFWI
nr:unnamed protein product [Callosobruchus chinensis]